MSKLNSPRKLHRKREVQKLPQRFRALIQKRLWAKRQKIFRRNLNSNTQSALFKRSKRAKQEWNHWKTLVHKMNKERFLIWKLFSKKPLSWANNQISLTPNHSFQKKFSNQQALKSLMSCSNMIKKDTRSRDHSWRHNIIRQSQTREEKVRL